MEARRLELKVPRRGGDSTGQGEDDEDDDDGIFIPPSEGNNDGSGGTWGDGVYADGIDIEDLRSIQESLQNGELKIRTNLQTDSIY